MNKTVYKVGFWAGLVAFGSTIAYFIVQLLQVFDVLSFPWDVILIFGFSLCISIPLLLEMLALHHLTPVEKKFWSHAALLLTVIYVVFVTANYVVQLTTVIPMTLKGTDKSIQLLKQTPHSLFWDFDAIGYTFMGLAVLFAVPIFKKRGFEKWVGYSFLAHALVTPLIVLVYFYPNFSTGLLFVGAHMGNYRSAVYVNARYLL